LEFLQFFLSLSLSSMGVLFDLLTTSIFVEDLGLEFEWNKLVKYIMSRWGYKVWIVCIEIPIILVLAFSDSSFSLIFPLGLSWLIGRGFVASVNLKTIVEYRKIGINEFKAQRLSRKQAFRNLSLSNRLILKLPYLIGLIISITIYILLLFSSFPTVPLLRSLSLGLIIIFLMKIIV